MTKQEQIAAFLDKHIDQCIELPREPIHRSPRGTNYPYKLPPRPTIETVARELLGNSEFKALQLGTWLGTTDGKVITKAVESVTPPFYQQDEELLVAALQHAAALQQQAHRQVAGRCALSAIGVAIVIAIYLSGSGPVSRGVSTSFSSASHGFAGRR